MQPSNGTTSPWRSRLTRSANRLLCNQATTRICPRKIFSFRRIYPRNLHRASLGPTKCCKLLALLLSSWICLTLFEESTRCFTPPCYANLREIYLFYGIQFLRMMVKTFSKWKLLLENVCDVIDVNSLYIGKAMEFTIGHGSLNPTWKMLSLL